MVGREIPTLNSMQNYQTRTMSFDEATSLAGASVQHNMLGGTRNAPYPLPETEVAANADLARRLGLSPVAAALLVDQVHQREEPSDMPAPITRRLVQVFIADPDENVPLADCLIYSGEQKLTDLTDQELYFEIDMRDALAKHNEKRAGFVNKKVKERIEKLDPVRIRDLKMTVVTIATF